MFKKAAESAGSSSGTGSQKGAPTVFKSSQEAEELNRTLTHLSNTSTQMCDFGKVNKRMWAKDVFALAHNGIRSELSDLSTALQALKAMRTTVTLNEYSDFRQWWGTFSSVVVDYLALEENVLMPWIHRAVENAEKRDHRAAEFLEASKGRRHSLRGAILAISKNFSALLDPLPPALQAKSPSKTKSAVNIVLHIDRVISLIADYMWEEEMQLSGVVSGNYPESEKDKVLKSMIEFMTSERVSRSSEFLVLQTRWMTDPKLAKSHTKFITAIHDCPYSKFQTAFEMNHAGAIAVLKVKGGLEG